MSVTKFLRKEISIAGSYLYQALFTKIIPVLNKCLSKCEFKCHMYNSMSSFFGDP